MTRVLMLVINPMTADTRVDKEAATLAAAGFDVTVCATAAPGLPAEEEREGFQILRLPYRRVLKDRATAPWHRAQARSALEIPALAAAVAQAGPSSLRVKALAGWHRARLRAGLVVARLWWYGAGSALKLLRSRTLPAEYWSGLVSRLPGWLAPCDVVHAHDLGTLAAAARLAQRWDAKVVYDSHELYVEQLTSWTGREKRLWKLHERRWIGRAAAVITVSEGIAAELQRRYRLAVRPTVVLNSPPRTPASSPSDVRADTGLAADRLLAVYVGTVKPGRGVDRLVPALAADPGWDLALVGTGPPAATEPLLDAARRSGVADRIHVLPAVPAAQLPAYLSTADVGVHPLEASCRNHDLALPNKLFDYLFAGLPVAVSRLPEMAALVTGRRLGATFDPGDPAQVAAAVRSAAQSGRPPALDDLLDHLAWDRQAERLLALYADLGLASAAAARG